ncbi:GNAT family N-acetyltransferase [Rheinheimera baltica]|jgi:RimJ/RimL family protein N-acetyltransferase|uniref:GNAT family N-acetyltransferase n=1 Tax=Rheinheimera baltica TaxID=67576 RepID=A0ABT9I2I5_9GAMM|nr:GNAT family N-acetyltransferase [Rheinheimera baltica]MDP5137161.1 GNAT family N-acetyltransferase [Rheinheimera baltica]MDP5190112.1 GNAT family N-acetyltransferase [Rheinheimera baltica]
MVIRVQPSARLSFSLLSDQDADLMFEVDQDEDVMRYLNGGKRTSMQQIIDVMLPRMALYRKPELGYGIWQVRRTDDNAYMGWVLIRPMGFDTETPSNNDVEIGWRFKKPFWGQGYASEAAAAVANAVVKANPKVRYLSATAMVENAGSIGVMRKLGMHFIKRYRHKDALGEVDAVLYRKEISSSC